MRIRLLLEEGARTLRTYLYCELKVTEATFEIFLKPYKTKMTALLKGKKSSNYSSSQHNILFPPTGVPIDTTQIDISLAYVLFRELPHFQTGKWGPRAKPGSLQQKVDRLRDLRNDVVHGVFRLSASAFRNLWHSLESAMLDLGACAADIQSIANIQLDHKLAVDRLKLETSYEQHMRKLKSTWFEVPRAVDNFTGRVLVTDKIKQYFEDGKEIVVLCGEGGVGKSEICMKYAA